MTDLQAQLQSTLRGSYTLERELGGGGMSRVFLADEIKLARKVVVKVLSPELAAGINAERFEREIRLAASLQQANIVPVLSTGETNGLPYYTMPFVEGESLRHRLAKGPALTLSDTLRILGDVARALQFAHDRGIVHRDIKPDNVLLSGGTAVVTDFGIAKAVAAAKRGGRPEGGIPKEDPETLTVLGTSIGTPAYMAPEQAAGDPNVDHRADIYAFGCMAYELLASHPPFHGRTPQRVLAAHMGEQPKPLGELRPDVPSSLNDLVMRSLAKDPSERPQSAAEVILALNAVTSGTGMDAVPQVLMHGPAAFRRALLVYFASVVGVAAVARAATVTIGLPTWVLPGALLIMALGLPVILFTGYVQSVTRRALTATPALTPGGSRQAQGTLATIALKASPHISWRRATRGGVYALGAFVVLIVAFMVMRAFGIGPAGSLFAAGALKQRDVLLVSDFTVRNADSSVASVVAEGVRANLAQSTSINLFNPANLAAALQRMQRERTARLDLPLAQELAKREGVKAIVTGDVTGLAGGFVIAVRLVGVDSGNTLAAYQTTVNGPKDLVAGVDQITRKLRGKMGESLKAVQAAPPLEQVTTASYEALRAYTEGTRAFDVERSFERAIPLLQRAVTIDTGFATAWRKLATAYANLQRPPSEVNAAITKAFQLRARLSENERALTEAYYYMRGPGYDRQRAIVAYQTLLDRGDTSYAANNLAVAYSSMRDYTKAESLYRMSIRKNPDNMIPVPNLAYVLFMQGKRAEFDSITGEGLKRAPNNATLIDYATGGLYFDGRYDEYERAVDSVRTTTKAPQVRIFATFNLAGVVQVRGRLAEGERRSREGQLLANANGSGELPIMDSLNMVQLDAWLRNQPVRAVQRLDASLAAHPLSELPETDRPFTEVASMYAVAGRPDKARALLAQLAQSKDTAYLRSRESDVHGVLGEIAMAEKRPRDAVAEFRRADVSYDGKPVGGNPVVNQFRLGRAFDLANEPDSAIVAWESYVQSLAGVRFFDDIYALAGVHKRLGELYDAKGNNAKAIAHLSKFVELWKHADPELQPAVIDARKRLARLTANEKR